MADDATPPALLELRLPRTVLDDLTAAASSRGQDVGSLVVEWLQDRLIHEQEKQQGLAKKVRRP